MEIVKGKPKRRTESRKISSASRPYILLAGFALENIMKGYLVACDPSFISDGNLRDDLKRHELTILAARIDGIALSENENRFCEVAESDIPYWGRYQVPLAYNRVVPDVGMMTSERGSCRCSIVLTRCYTGRSAMCGTRVLVRSRA